MVVGLLFGAETQVRYDVYSSTQFTQQTTSTYAPTYAPQYSMGYNPQLIIGSPYGSVTGGQAITPTVAPQVITLPGVTQSADPVRHEAPMGGGGGMGDLLIAGVAIVAGVLILPSLIKGFTKIKTKGLV